MGQSCVTWPPVAAREAGKCILLDMLSFAQKTDLFIRRGEVRKRNGFGHGQSYVCY